MVLNVADPDFFWKNFTKIALAPQGVDKSLVCFHIIIVLYSSYNMPKTKYFYLLSSWLGVSFNMDIFWNFRFFQLNVGQGGIQRGVLFEFFAWIDSLVNVDSENVLSEKSSRPPKFSRWPRRGVYRRHKITKSIKIDTFSTVQSQICPLL